MAIKRNDTPEGWPCSHRSVKARNPSHVNNANFMFCQLVFIDTLQTLFRAITYSVTKCLDVYTDVNMLVYPLVVPTRASPIRPVAIASMYAQLKVIRVVTVEFLLTIFEIDIITAGVK